MQDEEEVWVINAAERAMPATTAGGPKSPPIASILNTIRLLSI